MRFIWPRLLATRNVNRVEHRTSGGSRRAGLQPQLEVLEDRTLLSNVLRFSRIDTPNVDTLPTTVALGDFNGDGKQDLVVGTSGNVDVLLGNGDGTFQAPTRLVAGSRPNSVAVGDFNGDGKLDIVAANFSSSSLSVFLGNGNGTFQAPTTLPTGSQSDTPATLAVGDFNGDGKLDIAVGGLSSGGIGQVGVFLGNGNGTFQAIRRLNTNSGSGRPASVAVGDFNGDGKLDLLTANTNKTISVLLGNGDGTFQNALNFPGGVSSVILSPVGISVGDFNGDRKLDFAVANASLGTGSTVSVFLGNGDGTFQAARDFSVGSGPVSVATGDFNADAKLDLAVANALSNNVSVLAGNGDGTFQTAVNFTAGSAPSAVAVGDFNGDGSPDLAVTNVSTQNLSVLLNQAGTRTALISSQNPSTAGQSVTFTASVTAAVSGSGTPTGTVTFTVDGTGQTPVPLSNGQATFSTATLSGGRHTITAVYGGDSNFNPSTSAALTQTVNQAGTTTTTTALTSSPNPSTFGQSVTFTATVAASSGGTPTGTVSFTVDGTAQTAVPLSSGQATLSISTLNAGTHSITAAYNGDSSFTASTSAVLVQTVNKALTSLALFSSTNPSVVGQPLTFFARVTAVPPGAGTPTGTVRFLDGSTLLGTGTLGPNGVATFTTATLGVAAQHVINTFYTGDTNFFSISPAPLIQVVNLADVTIALTAVPNPAAQGQPVTLTARVGPTAPNSFTPTGNISFQGGGIALIAPLDSTGTATVTTAALASGSQTITAFYSGDGIFNPNAAKVVVQIGVCDPVQAYVTALYQTVLGRASDPGGFTFWVGRLRAGLSRFDVASGFETSSEHRSQEVDQFYHTFLHRAADDAGRTAFINFFVAGHSEAEVVGMIVSSPEYFALNTGTNAGFVNALYRDILQRQARPEEVALWLPFLQVNPANRASVAFSLLGSLESLSIAINDNFREILGRTASPAEQQLWLATLTGGGVGPASLTAAFLAANEFLARAAMIACTSATPSHTG
jgi:flagellar hook assembly protein FlgD